MSYDTTSYLVYGLKIKNSEVYWEDKLPVYTANYDKYENGNFGILMTGSMMTDKNPPRQAFLICSPTLF